MSLHKLGISLLILANTLGSVPFAEAAVTKSSQVGQNLLSFSEQLDNGAWVKNHITISPDVIANPLTGAKTADAYVEDGTTGYVFAARSVATVGSATFSAYVKAAGRNFASLLVQSPSGNEFFTVDLTTGQSVSSIAGASVSAQRISGGWWRLSVTQSSATNFYIESAASLTTDPAYVTTNGLTAIYVWGAQLVAGSKPGAYNRTGSSALNSTFVPAGPAKSNQFGQNLLAYSEQMGDATKWTHFHITGTQNTTETLDPWGTNKAAKIVEDGTTALHYVLRSVTANSTDKYTFSVFLKNGNRRYASVYLNDLTNTHQATFDLQTGTVTNVGSTVRAYMIPMGNGWYRCVVVANTPPGASPATYVMMNNSSGAYGAYAGDGASYLYIVGAQAALGSAPGAYNRTVASAINSTYVPTSPTQSSQVALRNVQLWLRADQGITLTNGAVSSWKDVFSGRGRSLTQGTAANQPLLVTGQNGRAAVRFDGSNDYLQTTFPLVQSFTVFMVYKHIALGASSVHDIVFDGGTAGTTILQSISGALTTNLYAGSSAPTVPVIANGAYTYAMLQFSGATSKIRALGVDLGTGNPGSTAAGGFTLGAQGNGARSTNIEVAEVIVTSAVPTTAEINAIETYFKARYGL